MELPSHVIILWWNICKQPLGDARDPVLGEWDYREPLVYKSSGEYTFFLREEAIKTMSSGIINGSAITFTEYGNPLKVLGATDFTIDSNHLKSNEVLLKTLATPINPSDLVQIVGVYPSKPKKTKELGTKQDVLIGGNEGLFKVIAAGANVKSFKEGDWVVPLQASFGTWRTHAVVSVDEDLQRLPLIKVSSDEDDKIGIEEVATISVNPPTGYDLVEDFIKDWDPNGNDWIIQNAGNSQVSMYVTQFARLRNIKTISIIRGGKPNQAEIEKQLYDLGATKVITEEQAESEEYKKKIVPGWLNGGSVILALNSVCGPSTATLVSYLTGDFLKSDRSPHLVTFGVMLGQPIVYSGAEQLFKNITTKAYWLSAKLNRDPQGRRIALNNIIDLMRQGKVRHCPYDKTYFDTNASSEDFIKLFAEKISSSSKEVIFYN